ncbi:TPA: hypothetical protein ACOELW_002485 [Enterobacter asburiae]|uniref:hypothetical protein n=1 Tax=Enterobacter TaxID=547 RepID=UPI0004B7878E|nr:MULTISPECIES: hypothetical protein [Enterobacter]MDU4482837.1 hypothetical protein [Enterobacter sp.]EKS6754434.1 hypothetical protein [Enterobacter asburiae]MBA7765283.1 hypothetical protein [Enterobacter asburiae]MBE4860649.1 hypothetical protein [Enterobacter cloacae complex sp. S3]MCL8127965.1 hypothetical protein [Enterobacter asburiae]
MEIVVEEGRMVVTVMPKPETPVPAEVVSKLALRKARDLKRFMQRIDMKHG